MADAIPVHSKPKKVDVKPAPAEEGAQVDPAKEAALAVQAERGDELAAAREAKQEAAQPSYVTDRSKDGIAGVRSEVKAQFELANHQAIRQDF